MGELNPSNNYDEHSRESCDRCHSILDVNDEMFIEFDGFEKALTNFGHLIGCKNNSSILRADKPSFMLCAKCAFDVYQFIKGR